MKFYAIIIVTNLTLYLVWLKELCFFHSSYCIQCHHNTYYYLWHTETQLTAGAALDYIPGACDTLKKEEV